MDPSSNGINPSIQHKQLFCDERKLLSIQNLLYFKVLEIMQHCWREFYEPKKEKIFQTLRNCQIFQIKRASEFFNFSVTLFDHNSSVHVVPVLGRWDKQWQTRNTQTDISTYQLIQWKYLEVLCSVIKKWCITGHNRLTDQRGLELENF